MSFELASEVLAGQQTMIAGYEILGVLGRGAR